MADILYDFSINASPDRVFRAVSTPEGLDRWWTRRSSGFSHTGWPSANEHFRVSSYCWAMYLRVLRRYLEHGEVVPYEQRDGV